MKSIFLTLLVFNTFSFASLWEGSIGNHKIFLQIEGDITLLKKKPYAFGGEYFYTSQLASIYFNCTDRKRLFLIVGSEYAPDEQFDLKLKGKKLVGAWSDHKQKLDVSLKYLGEQSLEDVRSKMLRFKREKTEKLLGKKEIVWIKEIHSNTHFFRLGNGFDKESRVATNSYLDRLQKKYSNDVLGCYNIGLHTRGLDGIKSEIRYISKNFIAFDLPMHFDCGGTHPDFYTDRYILDPKSGKRYVLEEILPIVKDYKKLFKLIKEKAVSDIAKGMYDPFEENRWEEPIEWSMDESGIYLYPTFASFEKCFRGDNFKLLYQAIQPYLSKKFLQKLTDKSHQTYFQSKRQWHN